MRLCTPTTRHTCALTCPYAHVQPRPPGTSSLHLSPHWSRASRHQRLAETLPFGGIYGHKPVALHIQLKHTFAAEPASPAFAAPSVPEPEVSPLVAPAPSFQCQRGPCTPLSRHRQGPGLLTLLAHVLRVSRPGCHGWNHCAEQPEPRNPARHTKRSCLSEWAPCPRQEVGLRPKDREKNPTGDPWPHTRGKGIKRAKCPTMLQATQDPLCTPSTTCPQTETDRRHPHTGTAHRPLRGSHCTRVP